MVKLNWFRGKSLGLALIYLGIMGIYQLLFMVLAQYGLQIGSRPIIILVPIGVILATFYSVIILFETNTTMIQYRQKMKYKNKKKKKKKVSSKQAFLSAISVLWKNTYIRPIFYTVIVFATVFGLSYWVCTLFVEEISSVFVLADNIGAIGCILFANYFDQTTNKKVK
ncbi:MAG: hypothetical protein K9W44_07285 [Candidatus Lokiarchaeota archaeon]|nr:hypothetical protein [Candidatus Harpocratesius repetitus]